MDFEQCNGTKPRGTLERNLCINMAEAARSVTDLLLEDHAREIPLCIVEEFEVNICVRGYHVYRQQTRIGE